MPTQLQKLNKHESNPFRPDVPDDFRAISPSLSEFMREQAEILREQHNLTQAGDSTFSWEILTTVDLSPRYNLGVVGRFYHPTYGIIHARYCRFASMLESAWLGGPLGLLKNRPGFTVTNDFSKSHPDFVIGVGGFYVAPPPESLGWVIIFGANIQSIPLAGEAAKFSLLSWTGFQQVGPSDSRKFVGLTGGAELDGETWAIPPGAALIELR